MTANHLTDTGLFLKQWSLLSISAISVLVHNGVGASAMLIIGVAASRFGLWMFDLSVTQLMQASKSSRIPSYSLFRTSFRLENKWAVHTACIDHVTFLLLLTSSVFVVQWQNTGNIANLYLDSS